MKQFNTNQTQPIKISNDISKEMSKKLLKLKYLLQNSKLKTIPNLEKKLNFVENNQMTSLTKSFSSSQQQLIGLKMSKDLSLYLSLIEKPLNLLFSIDKFLFEFSKKTYQQKKTGECFQQLKERKKLSLFYGHLTRKQIVNLFNKVKQNKGYFAKNFFSLLEKRLDIVLYRSGLTKTIAEARQLIKHKKILINQQIINVPSYSLNPGDFISITPETRDVVSNQLENLIKTTNKKNWNSVSRNEFYSRLIKILNLSQQKQRLNPFFYKSKKASIRSLKQGNISMNFQSKLLCDFMIQLLCTKIKLRSYWNLKKKGISTNNLNDYTYSRFSKKSFLTFFKWKSLSQKKQFFFKNEKSLNRSFKQENHTEKSVYANQGCLQKKPVFWSMINFQKNNKFFFQNSKKFQPNIHSQSKRPFNLLNKKNLRFYRTSFFVFLKFLENSNKFRSFITLSMKKCLFKKSKYNVKFKKMLNFRRIRPLHFEVSYNLLNVVYLFSPQRINFPFYIDLDLINRSLR